MRIKECRALVTGANRGIGHALAIELARRGAYLHAHTREATPSLKEELEKAGASGVQLWNVDLSKRENLDPWIKSLEKENIDLLINNAGLLTGGLIEEQKLDEIYQMLQVNVASLIHLSRGLVPGMTQRGRGKIVNNASVSALMHFPCGSTYCASKAAVWAFTESLHTELKGTGVSALCLITPGIKTRMFGEIEVKYGKNFDVPQEAIEPAEYARRVCEAIEDDRATLWPSGLTGAGVFVARHLPRLFQSAVLSRFRRT